MSIRRFSTWVCCCGLLVGAVRPLAAAADDRDKETELRRKTEEVERLKEALSRAQSDLKKTQEDNERLRKEQSTPPAAARAVVPAPAPRKPVTPMATLPPLRSGEVVEADDLIGHFQANPAAAAQRYQKKVFRVKGQVAHFGVKVMTRNYDVVFESPEKTVTPVFNFNYIDKWATVYTKQSGRALVGRTSGRTETTLLQLGDSVVIRGQCGGLKDGEIVFSNCEVAK